MRADSDFADLGWGLRFCIPNIRWYWCCESVNHTLCSETLDYTGCHLLFPSLGLSRKICNPQISLNELDRKESLDWIHFKEMCISPYKFKCLIGLNLAYHSWDICNIIILFPLMWSYRTSASLQWPLGPHLHTKSVFPVYSFSISLLPSSLLNPNCCGVPNPKKGIVPLLPPSIMVNTLQFSEPHISHDWNKARGRTYEVKEKY